MRFSKVERGWYATEDGRYAAIVDGFEPRVGQGAGDGDYEGFQSGEWAFVYDTQGRTREDHQAGQTLSWHPTKGEAVRAAERHAGA